MHSNFYRDFVYKDFVTGYLGIALYLIVIFGYKFWTKCKGIDPEQADFFTDKDIIDREEEEFLADKVAHELERGLPDVRLLVVLDDSSAQQSKPFTRSEYTHERESEKSVQHSSFPILARLHFLESIILRRVVEWYA